MKISENCGRAFLMRTFSGYFLAAFIVGSSMAASGGGRASKPMGSSGSENLKYRYEMSVDLSAMYVRDMSPQGPTDTAIKLNLGGLFTSWAGLDALGLYEVKSKSFLVGSTLRLIPIDWLFFKIGGGGFSDKATHEIKGTPILGAGLMGRFTEYYYLVAEATYFKASESTRNAGLSIGLGLIF